MQLPWVFPALDCTRAFGAERTKGKSPSGTGREETPGEESGWATSSHIHPHTLDQKVIAHCYHVKKEVATEVKLSDFLFREIFHSPNPHLKGQTKESRAVQQGSENTNGFLYRILCASESKGLDQTHYSPTKTQGFLLAPACFLLSKRRLEQMDPGQGRSKDRLLSWVNNIFSHYFQLNLPKSPLFDSVSLFWTLSLELWLVRGLGDILAKNTE